MGRGQGSWQLARASAAGLAILLAGVALAACSGSGGRETIRFSLSKPEAIPYMRELVQEYNNSQNQVNVVLDTSGIDSVSAGFVRGDPPVLVDPPGPRLGPLRVREPVLGQRRAQRLHRPLPPLVP